MRSERRSHRRRKKKKKKKKNHEDVCFTLFRGCTRNVPIAEIALPHRRYSTDIPGDGNKIARRNNAAAVIGRPFVPLIFLRLRDAGCISSCRAQQFPTCMPIHVPEGSRRFAADSCGKRDKPLIAPRVNRVIWPAN